MIDGIPVGSLEKIAEHVSILPEKTALAEKEVVSGVIDFVFRQFLPKKLHLMPGIRFRAFASGERDKVKDDFSVRTIYKISYGVWVVNEMSGNSECLGRVVDGFKTARFVTSDVHAELLANIVILHEIFCGSKRHVNADDDCIKWQDGVLTVKSRDVSFIFPKFETVEEIVASFTCAGYDMKIDFSELEKQ